MKNLADITCHELPAAQAIARLERDPSHGLAAAEIEVRQRQFGLNQMTTQKRISAWLRFLLQFHQPLIYILLATTAIAAAMGKWVDASVIFGVAFINAAVGYYQEAGAEKAIEALAKLVLTEAKVWRGGEKMHIPSAHPFRASLPRSSCRATWCCCNPATACLPIFAFCSGATCTLRKRR